MDNYGRSAFSVDGNGVLQSNNPNYYSSSFISDATYGPGTGDFVFTMEHVCGPGSPAEEDTPGSAGTSRKALPTPKLPILQLGQDGRPQRSVDGRLYVVAYSGAHQTEQFEPSPCDARSTLTIHIRKTGGGAFIFMGSSLLNFNPDTSAACRTISINTQVGDTYYNWRNFTGVTNGTASSITVTPGSAQYYLQSGNSTTITATVSGFNRNRQLGNLYF